MYFIMNKLNFLCLMVCLMVCSIIIFETVEMKKKIVSADFGKQLA